MPDRHWSDEIDTRIPNVARMYDYVIGGKNNFPADRRAAEQLTGLSSYVIPAMRENRHFLRRVVRFLTTMGIRQFLDIGAGLPTVGNVHEVAQNEDPTARVIYVDNDPVVLVHARALMADSDKVRVVSGDARRPDEILTDPTVRIFFDWDAPVAVLMIGLLHFVPDADDPYQVVRSFRDVLSPGSYLALSHGTEDGYDPTANRTGLQAVYRSSTAPTQMRTRAQITEFFEGFQLIEPGVVYVQEWRPSGISEGVPAERTNVLGGVGYLPGLAGE